MDLCIDAVHYLAVRTSPNVAFASGPAKDKLVRWQAETGRVFEVLKLKSIPTLLIDRFNLVELPEQCCIHFAHCTVFT